MNTVLSETKNQILRLRLNRPEARNAFNAQMISELTLAFSNIPQSVRVAVLEAEGDHFSAGADLGYMKAMAQASVGENQKDAEKLFEMFDAVAGCPIPVLAKVVGSTFGGGVGLLACCDIVVAHKDAQFAFTEAKVGLVPSTISSFVLKKMAASHARELMLTAEIFSADRALRSGLIHFVGEPEEIDDYLQSKIEYIKGNGPEAVRLTKSLLGFLQSNPSKAEVKKYTTQLIAERRVSSEGQEGLSAFFEKRKPSWKEEKV